MLRRSGSLCIALWIFTGCTVATQAPPPTAATQPVAPVNEAPVSEPPVAAVPPPVREPAAVTPPVATGPAVPSTAATPTTPREPSKSWPFVVWDRAEAIAYNHVPYGPGIQLRVYDGDGWSRNIVDRKPITTLQGKIAAAWVEATLGEVEVSKCPFPRHAVVLYAGEQPVGSVNVCFSCGDILVWPDVPAGADERRYKRKLAVYKKVFPRWKQLFRDELGFPLEPALR